MSNHSPEYNWLFQDMITCFYFCFFVGTLCAGRAESAFTHRDIKLAVTTSSFTAATVRGRFLRRPNTTYKICHVQILYDSRRNRNDRLCCSESLLLFSKRHRPEDCSVYFNFHTSRPSSRVSPRRIATPQR